MTDSRSSEAPPRTFRWFRNDAVARFAERPNRFVVWADRLLPDGGTERVRCHCPNPGRLTELLHPGAELILEAAPPGRATEWSLAAVIHQPLDGGPERVVPLHSARANQAAGTLVLPRLFPDALAMRAEVRHGRSRFDWQVDTPAGGPTGMAPGKGTPLPLRHLVEVKCCTEVEFGSALFPDAPSTRAVRHLEELAAATGGQTETHVLFVIPHGNPQVFRPNAHTDPAFARTLADTAGRVQIHAVALEVDREGWTRLSDSGGRSTRGTVLREGSIPAPGGGSFLPEMSVAPSPPGYRFLPEVSIDLSPAALAGEDRGNYFVVLHLDTPRTITAGAREPEEFLPGWYVYCGSAMARLSSRMARHLRKAGKKMHWHLDWLAAVAGETRAYAVAGRENRECLMAARLGDAGGILVPGFGNSDCRCRGHLYRFGRPPAHIREFRALLMELRHC